MAESIAGDVDYAPSKGSETRINAQNPHLPPARYHFCCLFDALARNANIRQVVLPCFCSVSVFGAKHSKCDMVAENDLLEVRR
ncbi:MAG: hypothetical protein JJ897_16730 [Marinibacterium sp.]|nr:hypothetical protein [Marinibacterium sp.]